MHGTAKDLAQRFHDIYERLAPEFGYETRTETRSFDPESANGRLMIAVCAEILLELGLSDEGLTAQQRADLETYGNFPYGPNDILAATPAQVVKLQQSWRRGAALREKLPRQITDPLTGRGS